MKSVLAKRISFFESYINFNLDSLFGKSLYPNMKKKTPNVVPVEVKGLPNTVKVGYRDIKIKYVRPDFKTDDMTESYGEYRPREGVILIQHDLCGKSAVILRGMKFYTRWYIYFLSTKLMAHSKKMMQKN